jgi:hypothetical protein
MRFLFTNNIIHPKSFILFIFLFAGLGSISKAQVLLPPALISGLFKGEEENCKYIRISCDSFPDPKPVLTEIMLESGFTKPGEIIIKKDESVQYRKKFILMSKVSTVKIVAKKYPIGGITYFVRIVTIDDRFQLETKNQDLALRTASIFCCMANLK